MRIFIFSLLMGVAGGFMAQQNFCYTTELQNKWFAAHPEAKAKFEQLQNIAAQQDVEMAANGYQTLNTINSHNRTSSATSTTVSNYTIPIVFHILHTGGGENISDAQIQDAVSILTRDYNMRNPDTSDVVVSFKNLIGNPKFEFQLATKDPNGNCTNGIIRHWDTNTDWTENFSDYIYTWDPTKYLNVYVVKTMGNGAAGYTYLPGTGVPTNADAVVILSTYVGSIGSGADFSSRALTHEVGHWFNLAHLWGNTNQPGVACGDDGVSDTPITKGYSACNLNNSMICNPGIVENMQNYMDYAYCQRMFTLGQTARVITSINNTVNSRNNISTATNLAFTGVTSPGTGCIPGIEIASMPSATICAGRPISLLSYSFNAAPTNYVWTSSNDAIIAAASNYSTAITFTSAGTKTVTCVASNGNGTVTQNVTVEVRDATPQITSTYAESFESGSIPTNWSSITPSSPSESWLVSGDAASEGFNSAYIPGETFQANAIAILESPSYDFKNNPGSVFSFKYAYAKQTSTNKDKFKIQASKDCGGTWLDVYAQTNTALANGSGGTTNTLYYPASNEWKLFSGLTNLPVFTPFLSQQNVTLRFYFQEDVGGIGFGNRLYLDEVNFSAPTGINEFTKQISLNIYPNPTSSTFNLSFELANTSKIKYNVTSVTGAVLISENEKTMASGAHEIKINENGKLSAGIYFVNLDMNGIKMSKKIIIGS